MSSPIQNSVGDVGDLTQWVLGRSHGQVSKDRLNEQLDVLVFQRRNFKNRNIATARRPATLGVFHPRVAVIATWQVQFVENQDLWLTGVSHNVIDALVFGSDGTRRVDNMNQDIDPFERVANFVVKILNEPARLRCRRCRAGTSRPCRLRWRCPCRCAREPIELVLERGWQSRNA